MEAWVWIAIGVAVIVLVAAVVLWSMHRVRQKRDLRDWFRAY